MITWKNAVIREAAAFLNTTPFGLQNEAANHPECFDETSLELSLQRAAQNFAAKCRADWDAERAFFKSHPELNP